MMSKKLILCLWMTFSFAVAMTAANRKFVLVIDAGHGGHDAGALGYVSKEKDLTLRYALAFGAAVEKNCPDVKVIYTRKTDVFVELWRRAEIANQAKADLFVSVHINSVGKGRIARGYQTYTLGKGESGTAIDKNLDVAKRENSVILLEPNYQQIYQGYDPNSPESDILFEFIQDNNMERSVQLSKYMQRYVCRATGRQDMGAHQKNLAVLRLSAMPGCLMELGFISTADEEQFMNSAEAVKLYTQGFFNAFMAYKKRYNENITIPYEPDNAPAIEIPSVVPTSPPAVSPEERVVTPQPDTPSQPASTTTPPTVSQEEEAVVTTEAPEPSPTDIEAVAAIPPGRPVFKVQITANSTKLKANAAQLKGVRDVDYYQEGGLYKYTVGASTDYNEISRLRKQLLDKFPQAFIIAFKNGQRCDVQEAIREFRQNRNKR